MRIQHLCQAMADIAPLRLAEDWDNVGLLLGDRAAPVARVMTCLTVTSAVVDEAEAENVDLLIAHHPLPFQPMRKITTDSAAGNLLWRLCRSGTSLYSAHTAYDSAIGGINDQWCEALGLRGRGPLVAKAESAERSEVGDRSGENGRAAEKGLVGAGRYGDLLEPRPAREILMAAAKFSGAARPRMVGDDQRPVQRIGVACGSGASFLGAARRVGCDLLLTGEATFHNSLEAENTGIFLAMLGHYASERFAMESLAQRLQTSPDLLKIHAKSASTNDFRVWASHHECDVIAVDRNSPNP